MARDNFRKETIERLAKRVGMKCSCPECRLPTAGPDSKDGVTNVGVAAHITAASAGGARYDPTISPDERTEISNAIWLCQTHAKLIDDDELSYTVSVLRDWKETAERMAWLEALGFAVQRASPFPDLEKKAPALVAEMREDLQSKPLVRQFILMSKKASYNSGSTPYFVYYYEDHDFLDSVITIMIHAGAVYDIAFNRVPRYNFDETFVHYLLEAS